MATVEAEIQCYRYRGMGIKLTLEQQADGGSLGLACFGLRMRRKVLVCVVYGVASGVMNG